MKFNIAAAIGAAIVLVTASIALADVPMGHGKMMHGMMGRAPMGQHVRRPDPGNGVRPDFHDTVDGKFTRIGRCL